MKLELEPFTHNPAPEAAKPQRLCRRLCQASVTAALMGLCSVQAFAASTGGTTIWTKAQEIMSDVYGQVVTISTIAAVMTASIALLLMNFSKNGRTVDESRAWLKRICVTWAIINGLGFIMAYVTPFFQGGQWNG